MRLLFAGTPAVGHVHPLVPFASAAVEAGHEVAFATGAALAPVVEGSGFRCFPVGSDWISNQDVDRLVPQMRGRVGKERAALHWRHLFAEHFPHGADGWAGGAG